MLQDSGAGTTHFSGDTRNNRLRKDPSHDTPFSFLNQARQTPRTNRQPYDQPRNSAGTIHPDPGYDHRTPDAIVTLILVSRSS